MARVVKDAETLNRIAKRTGSEVQYDDGRRFNSARQKALTPPPPPAPTASPPIATPVERVEPDQIERLTAVIQKQHENMMTALRETVAAVLLSPPAETQAQSAAVRPVSYEVNIVRGRNHLAESFSIRPVYDQQPKH